MSDRMNRIRALRAPEEPHQYNCAQALLVGFHDVLGVSGDQAARMSAFYGGGMLRGTVCGTISAGLMILGAAGVPQQEANQFLQSFVKAHGSIQCAELLARSHARGIPKKEHCDGLIFEIAAALEKKLGL